MNSTSPAACPMRGPGKRRREVEELCRRRNSSRCLERRRQGMPLAVRAKGDCLIARRGSGENDRQRRGVAAIGRIAPSVSTDPRAVWEGDDGLKYANAVPEEAERRESTQSRPTSQLRRAEPGRKRAQARLIVLLQRCGKA